MNIGKKDLSHHKMYFKVAKEKLNEASGAQNSVRALMADRSGWVKQDSVDQVFSEFSEAAITSIIFSGLTAESFINYYGISRLSKSQFNNYLDKLDLLAKWIVIPKFVTGNSIDTGSQAIFFLQKLIRSRNKLVHYKSSKNTSGALYSFLSFDEKDNLPWMEDAKVGVQSIYMLFSELVNIDSSIKSDETEWDEESDYWCELWD